MTEKMRFGALLREMFSQRRKGAKGMTEGNDGMTEKRNGGKGALRGVSRKGTKDTRGMTEKWFAGFALPCFFLSQRRKGAKGNDGGGMTEKRKNGMTE